jgi:hypothetical protein
MALTTGHASAAPSLTIFDGFVGYDSVIASKLDEAKSEVQSAISSKATSGDLNNMCVIYALSDEYLAAESVCSNAVAMAKKENVSRKTLKTMKNNLGIVVQKLEMFSSAAD